jgi:hypothetical protein
MLITPAEALRGYLDSERISPERLGETCNPTITGQSVRQVLLGRRVGAKVARALAGRVPGLSVADLIEPPAHRKRRRGRAA